MAQIPIHRTKRHRACSKLLNQVFGYENFRPQQYEIIHRVLSGEDVCAILPTGFGKSLTFQMVAVYRKIPAIVVCPLISLMNDQVRCLAEFGITACCYNSEVDKFIMRREILDNKYQLVFITPESLNSHMTQDMLLKLTQTVGVSVLAIDEAHCVSSYGHSFRPAYREELLTVRDYLPCVPVLAVTATATREVTEDIIQTLHMDVEKVIQTSFDRPNLFLQVEKKPKTNSLSCVVAAIQQHPGCCAIIYCITRKDTQRVATQLTSAGFPCNHYHAGMKEDDKKKATDQFFSGEINYIAATVAFGMGINKSDVRMVIHYGISSNMESYYQEIGRAGRDGEPSWCYLFYSENDVNMRERLIKSGGTSGGYCDKMVGMLRIMHDYCRTDVCRRHMILAHFGEDSAITCTNCDNCTDTNPVNTNSVVKQNVEKEAIQVIEAILNLDKTFGIGFFSDFMRGSKSKKVLPYAKSQGYGEGKSRSRGWWVSLINFLIENGFVEREYYSTGPNSYTIRISNIGSRWYRYKTDGTDCHVEMPLATIELE